MTAEQAIHNFWSSFALPAYDENSVPDTAELPYITYSLSYDAFGNNVPMVAKIWQRSMSWQFLTDKVHQIFDAISDGGKNLQTDSGFVKIYRGTPFYRRESDDEGVKRMSLNITAEYITDFD